MKKGKILFLCPYPVNVAPSQRLKYEQYFEKIQAAGYAIKVLPFIKLDFWKIIYKKGNFFLKCWYTLAAYVQRYLALFTIRKYDIIYVHLWATPFGPPFYEWWLRKLAKKIIYDIDDLVYLKNIKSQANFLVTYIKGRKKPIFLMQQADHVITCTPYLDEFVKQYNAHTTDISSTVDTDIRYVPVNKYSNDTTVTLGWSGSLNTSKYFYLLEPVLRQLKEKFKFNILVIGDNRVQINGLDIEAIEWNDTTEIKNLQRIDIGLYPLPDEEWVLGKSGLKAIQYMALGIPVVATAIGANYRVIEDGVSGFLVKSEKEWVEKIGQLMENPSLRKSMGTAARKRAEQLFSIKANFPKYLNVIEKVLND
jgi:glycosyltransferase involved in cell wall biosynthesis